MLADAADHFSVDKCAGGCTAYVQLHAALFLQNADRKILITLQQLLTIIQIVAAVQHRQGAADRKSTRLNSSHVAISYAVFCLKKKNKTKKHNTYHNTR